MKKRDFPKEAYKGGRCLSAISRNINLSTNEKCLLFVIAGEMDFNSDFSEARWESIETLSRYTNMSTQTVRRIIKRLQKSGYLISNQRYMSETKRQLTNSIYIADKLFSEYLDYCKSKPINKVVEQPEICALSESHPIPAPESPYPCTRVTPSLYESNPNSLLENSLEINSCSLTINKPSNVPSAEVLSTSCSNDLFKKVRGKYPSKAPKEFTASEAHKHIARLFKEHLNTNARSTKHIPSDRDLEFQIALLLKQTHLRKPEMNELTLEAFVKFLHVLMDKNNHWQGWGVNFLSIPAALVTKNGSTKLEKAWLSFGQIYEKQRELYEYTHERQGAGTPDCPY